MTRTCPKCCANFASVPVRRAAPRKSNSPPTLLILLGVGLGLVVCPQTAKAKATTTPAAAQKGSKFAPRNGMFSIALPAGESSGQGKQVFTIEGRKVPVESSRSVLNDGTSFTGSSIGIPAAVMRNLPAEKRFDVFRDVLVKQMQGKVVAEKDVKQGPVPGKEYQMEVPKGAARMQLFTVGGWIVLAIVEGKTKEVVNNKQADAFFKSLKLTDKAKDVFRRVKR